ncbi:MAG: efflux RND transporter periplasmic adaptor subunit [Litorimonas sp.]
MRRLGRLLTNLWVWLAIIAVVAVIANAYLNRASEQEEGVTLAPTLAPSSPYALSQNAVVEVEGGIVLVSANRTGTIKEVLVAEGDQVKQGQVLALQEDRDDRIALRLAEIAVENEVLKQERSALDLDIARRNVERAATQREQDAISQQQLETQQDNLTKTELAIATNGNSMERAQTQLETARFNLAQRRVISPVDGRILTAAVTAGAGVSAENISTAFSIIPDAPKRLRAKVREDDIDSVYIGQIVDFAANNRSKDRRRGVVVQIGAVFSAAETNGRAQSNTVDVVIEAEDIPFRLGKTVLVQFRKADAPDA